MAGSHQCNDWLCFAFLCDRYDHSIYLCEIPAYGRITGGFKYIKTGGHCFDRNVRNYNLYTGSFSRKYGRMESYELAAGRDFSFVYVFADHKEEYSMFVANCIDAQSNAYEEFVKDKLSYSASEQMESWDEKENQMVPIYCTTLMSTTGVLNYFAKVEEEQLKIDFYDERKRESFTNQVTKSEYLLKEIPAERISVLLTGHACFCSYAAVCEK